MERRFWKWARGLLAVLWLSGFGQPAAGEEKTPGPKGQEKSAASSSFVDSLSLTSQKEPIQIKANELEWLYDAQRIIYRGNVVAIQGDTTLKCSVLTVTYETPPEANAKSGQSKPERTPSRERFKEVVAEGSVDITSGERHATGKKAIFNEASRTVVLSGNAVLRDGGNQVTGETVTVFLDEKRSTVVGRAEMVIIPAAQQTNGKSAKTP
jgi:lipopolysaccharide export system protein LptA